MTAAEVPDYGDKFVDLDAAFAEIDEAERPMGVKLFGEMWELPGSIPAAVSLRLYEWSLKGWIDDDGNATPEVNTAEMTALLRDMVPRDILNEWFARGLGTNKLDALVTTLIDRYEQHITAMEGGAEGKAPAPARGRGSSKSSKGGRSSKRTSTASTGSKISRAS